MVSGNDDATIIPCLLFQSLREYLQPPPSCCEANNSTPAYRVQVQVLSVFRSHVCARLSALYVSGSVAVLVSIHCLYYR
eukprot:m.159639 g.159639  ORF g.159639 m.159639 type:complete len:79 (-) comp31143_c0_seq1:58-294(-)